jgi:hypothetical protein
MFRRSLAALSLLALAAGCAPQPVAVVAVPVQGCNTAFRIVNASSRTVLQFYFSHSSLATWGADQLGANVLPPGAYTNFVARNAGAYDFRVTYVGGGASEIRQVNICRASEIRVTNGGMIAI